jgi:hypothetical protein
LGENFSTKRVEQRSRLKGFSLTFVIHHTKTRKQAAEATATLSCYLLIPVREALFWNGGADGQDSSAG